MSRLQFLNALCDALDRPHGSVTGPETLQTVDGWDSLAIIGLISLLDERHGILLSPSALADCRTVDDLVAASGATH